MNSQDILQALCKDFRVGVPIGLIVAAAFDGFIVPWWISHDNIEFLVGRESRDGNVKCLHACQRDCAAHEVRVWWHDVLGRNGLEHS